MTTAYIVIKRVDRQEELIKDTGMTYTVGVPVIVECSLGPDRANQVAEQVNGFVVEIDAQSEVIDALYNMRRSTGFII